MTTVLVDQAQLARYTRSGNQLISLCPHPHSHNEVDAVLGLLQCLQQTDDGPSQDAKVSQDIGAPDLWDLIGQNWAGVGRWGSQLEIQLNCDDGDDVGGAGEDDGSHEDVAVVLVQRADSAGMACEDSREL